jgi:hypothetical protein
MARVRTLLVLLTLVLVASVTLGSEPNTRPELVLLGLGDGGTDTVTIWAGQHYDAGDVIVGNTDEYFVVKISTQRTGWTMSQSHVIVCASPAEIPTNRGVYAPGQFPYQADHDPAVDEYTYLIPIGDFELDDVATIAVHVVVTNPQGVEETGWAYAWKGYFFYTVRGWQDVGVVDIVEPEGSVDAESDVLPRAAVKNYGNEASSFKAWLVLYDPTDSEVYRVSVNVVGLAPGGEQVLVFPTCNVGNNSGEWIVKCSLDLSGDGNPTNDYAVNWFLVRSGGGTYVDWGWEEVAIVPWSTSRAPVYKGGWLVFHQGNGLVYGGKGNKTGEFFCYDPFRNSWTELASVPSIGRPPYKGCRGITDNRDRVYLAKGNNTLEFWCYTISKDTWVRLADIPAGETRKRVKGGSDMVFVREMLGRISQSNDGYIYLLKGYKTGFCRYSVADDTWEEMADAPTGVKGKWGRGSWLVFDGVSKIYAHKAKYHELWTFDVNTHLWSETPLAGMPFVSPTYMKKKRSKDGGSADWFVGEIHGLKGGNTQEFWKYSPADNRWTELDTMPSDGTTCKRKRVKQGGDFVSFPAARVFYATKGNKTSELWRYRLPPEDYVPPSGPQADPVTVVRGAAMSVAPNPVTGGRAQVRLSLPKSSSGVIRVLDVAGRVATTREFEHLRSGSVDIDLGALSTGVYLIQAETDGIFLGEKVLVMD